MGRLIIVTIMKPGSPGGWLINRLVNYPTKVIQLSGAHIMQWNQPALTQQKISSENVNCQKLTD